MDTPVEQASVAAPPDAPAPKRTFEKYEIDWPLGTSPLAIELACFKIRHEQEDGGLGAAGHFREITAILWGEDNDQKKFIWSPWADTMLEYSLAHKYLAVSGCASAGKSDFYAVYAIVNWLADPANTMVLVTSTSLKESRGRIWGALEEYWNAAQRRTKNLLPGKLVSSVGLIKLDDPTGEYKTSDRSGIHLLAGEKRKEKDSIGKLIGLKNSRVFFIADELPELSPAILEAAFGNLDANPFFQLIGIGNPNSIYDPHGTFSKPKNGWSSITPNDTEWETEKGYHIRFDAYKSPNVLAGRVVYPWLPTQAKINEKKKELGEDSLAFWRMWRAFWCPTGGTESVVAEADIVGYDCESKEVRWEGIPLQLSFLDPGFTNGGDRSAAFFALFGKSADTGKLTLLYTDYVILFEDTMNKKVARNFQIAQQWRDLCIARGIQPQCAGVDDTGAAAFGDIVHTVWSPQVYRLNFGGAPTKNPVSANDKTLACDKYKNRVTEIWCSVREFIRGGQIRGIIPDLGVELTARKMVQRKTGAGLKAEIQSKEVMRAQTGKSPDIADAALGLLDLLRTKFKFRSAALAKKTVTSNGGWKQFLKKNDYNSKHGAFLDRS